MVHNVCVTPIVVISPIWWDNNNGIYFSFNIFLLPPIIFNISLPHIS